MNVNHPPIMSVRRSTRECHKPKRFRFSEYTQTAVVLQHLALKKQVLQRARADKAAPPPPSDDRGVPGYKELNELKQFIARTGGFPVENDMDTNSSDSYDDDGGGRM